MLAITLLPARRRLRRSSLGKHAVEAGDRQRQIEGGQGTGAVRSIGDRKRIQPEGGVEQSLVALHTGTDLQPATEVPTLSIILK
ncbi:hypothetical protein [Ensifer sp. BR816]|uniref:hypothetical protein n=1 Tax=Rhizobium sp. (strain BR816) TaxID=1057002 RepID=UPI00037B1D41|nr:hypothetical protein [Ensifer sp. BR816]